MIREFMCKLSGYVEKIRTTKSDDNGNITTVLTIHYTDNGKCEPNNMVKLEGNHPFECKPIKHKIMEKILVSVWKAKYITVGCEVGILTQHMCKLSGDAEKIKTAKRDDNGKISVLTTHYTDNTKCEPNNMFKLVDNRQFECKPIKHNMMERIPGSTWKNKKISVGCEVVILS